MLSAIQKAKCQNVVAAEKSPITSTAAGCSEYGVCSSSPLHQTPPGLPSTRFHCASYHWCRHWEAGCRVPCQEDQRFGMCRPPKRLRWCFGVVVDLLPEKALVKIRRPGANFHKPSAAVIKPNRQKMVPVILSRVWLTWTSGVQAEIIAHLVLGVSVVSLLKGVQ